MTIARRRSHFKPSNSAFIIRIIARDRSPVILLVRAAARGILIAGVATASRVIDRLSWQTDGVIAAVVAASWVVFAEAGL